MPHSESTTQRPIHERTLEIDSMLPYVCQGHVEVHHHANPYGPQLHILEGRADGGRTLQKSAVETKVPNRAE